MDALTVPESGPRVNINRATAEAMSDGVLGIGPVLAERIVAYRQEHGLFTTLDQLIAVQGIGPRSLELYRDQLTLSDEPEAGVSPASAVDTPAPAESAPAPAESGSALPTEAPSEPPDALAKLEADIVSAQAQAAMLPDVMRSSVIEPGPAVWEQPSTSDQPPELDEAAAAGPAAPALVPSESPPLAAAPPDAAPEALPAADEEDEEPGHSAEQVAAEAAAALEAEVVAAPHLLDDRFLYTRTGPSGPLEPWDPSGNPPAQGGADQVALGRPGEDVGLPLSAEPAEVAAEFEGEAPLYRVEPEAASAAEPKGATETMSDQDRPANVSPTPTPAAAAPASPSAAPEPRQGRGFWGGFWLVLLGGALGVILTLLVAIIWSGTVDFAPRRQVEALDRNLGTMQANQELGWQRLDELTVQNQELARKVAQLETLGSRVGTLEQDLGVAQTELATTQADLKQLGEDVTQMRVEIDTSLARLDGRLTTAEEQITGLQASLDELQAAFAKVEKRVQSFDVFFTNLRDLLIDMQGSPPTPTPTEEPEIMTPQAGAPTQEKTPVATATPSP